MKTLKIQSAQRNKNVTFLSFVVFLFISLSIHAQNKQALTGVIIEEESNKPVPFANVVLFTESDAGLEISAGSMSNENGVFNLVPVHAGKFKLRISSVGYTLATADLEIKDLEVTDAGVITLKDSTFLLEETRVVAQRAGGKSESDKTIFFVNKKVLDVAGNGTDVLKYIPGVQVDLKQNISLEGSTNIRIYIDGVERDQSYVSQLNPVQIDKIEVINTPPSGYDSNVTGVINIILKKKENTGVSGHIYAEVPTSTSEVFLFPSLGIRYGFKKLDLFASCNGELNYENIDECVYRKKFDNSVVTTISSVQEVRQRNISGKFHYGLDYFMNEKNQLNYYGFYNPYSNEQNGNESVTVSGSEAADWNAERKEKDKNSGIYNALFYKHIFGKDGSEITFDINHFYLDARNTTSFISASQFPGSLSYLNKQNPKQNAFSAKTDLVLPLSNTFVINFGGRARFRTMNDNSSDKFSFSEKITAVYATINYRQAKINFNAGVRAENSIAEINKEIQKSVFTLLPYFTANYKLNSRQNIKAAFNQTVNRPSVYQINSFSTIENPFSVSKGNPQLKPEFVSSFSVEHTVQFKSSYVSTRFFYNQTNDAMNYLTSINKEGIFATQMQNLGTIRQLGAQFLGSLKAGPVNFNPVVRLYNLSTSGNEMAVNSGVKNRKALVFEPSLSSILSLKNDLAFSVIFQYSTPKINIQDNAFCGALYFISVDKTFKNRIKIGAFSALPFTRNFIYQGSETKTPDFSSRYEGHLKLSVVPLWFRISYQFSSGATHEKINRPKEEIDQRAKRGF